MQGAIEAVHLEQGETLKTFEGDTAPFEKSRRHIESCLQQARQETDRRGISILTWAILLAIAAGLGYWIFSSMRQERLWRRYVERLDSGPGLAVTRWEEDWSVYRLWGLRDPFAEDPYAIAGEMGVDFEDFIAHWEPYSSGDPQLVFDRLVLLLEPPAGVTLSVDRGVAYARGRASHRWIVRARKRIAELPVSLPYVDDQLVDTDWNALLATKSHVETVVIQFPRSNSADLSASEVRKLDRLTRDIRDMAAAAQAFGALVKVSVFGHTSRTGSEELNVTLSQARADAVAAYLVSKGFDRSIFTPIGVGWNDPARQETTETDRAANRRVSFKVDVIGVLKP